MSVHMSKSTSSSNRKNYVLSFQEAEKRELMGKAEEHGVHLSEALRRGAHMYFEQLEKGETLEDRVKRLEVIINQKHFGAKRKGSK